MWWFDSAVVARAKALVVAPAKAGAQFLALALFLSACGFQLRGEPAFGIKALYLSAAGPSTVATDIKRSLSSGPTRIVTKLDEAEAQLRILGEAREKQVATITGTGRVYEFELRLIVRYELTVPGRELPVIAPTEVLARRLITYSETAPIAKEAEEQLLYKDMQAELAQRILRSVAVARREI